MSTSQSLCLVRLVYRVPRVYRVCHHVRPPLPSPPCPPSSAQSASSVRVRRVLYSAPSTSPLHLPCPPKSALSAPVRLVHISPPPRPDLPVHPIRPNLPDLPVRPAHLLLVCNPSSHICFLYFLLINFIVSTSVVYIIFIINLRIQCFTSIVFLSSSMFATSF